MPILMILLAASTFGILGLVALPSAWSYIYKRNLFTSTRGKTIRAQLRHRIEGIKQDPLWIEKIESEGPSALYNELAKITSKFNDTSAQEDRVIIWDLIENSGLINQRYLK
jgi:hypothetical protein